MNGRVCVDCDVGSFQDLTFHRNATCASCSGTNIILFLITLLLIDV